MAGLLLETGQLPEAKIFGERAVAVNPQDPEALNNLGRCYYAQRMLTEALACFQRAVAIKPNEASLHFACGSILSELSRFSQAETAMRQAVLLAPNAESLANLASIELLLGQTAEAIRFARRAVKKDQASVSAHMVLAQALLEDGQREEADKEWTTTFSLSADPGPLYSVRARALIGMGEFEAAMSDLHRAIELQPRQGFPYFAIASAKRIQATDVSFVSQVESVLAEGQVPEEDQRHLHYALGKAYDNLGEYERAMDQFDRANALYLRTSQGKIPFDRHSFQATIDARINVFTREFFARAKSAGNESAMPIFVVGMMRSGTTLAEQILSCHPLVGGAGEQPFWIQNESQSIDYPRRAANPKALAELTSSYLATLSKSAPDFPRVVDKNPANILVAGLLHLAFPNAKIIHTRRNPVDVALSIWMTPMETSAQFVGDRENIVFAYKEILRLAQHWKEVLPVDQYMEVSYEDLIADPESGTRNLLEFCGLAWSDLCLHPERNVRAVKTPSFWQVRQPVYKSSVDRWKRYEPWLGPFLDLK
jgi:tetratricopeptide (TPR) repeat protein